MTENGRYEGISFGGKTINEVQKMSIMKILKNALPNYPYDQYRNYPSKRKGAWQSFFIYRLEGFLKSEEWTFFFSDVSANPALIGCRISSWDEEHFGIRMASIYIFKGNDMAIIDDMLDYCLKYLRKMGVDFVSTRINSDNMAAIHSFQEFGFKYIETIIWPVLKISHPPPSGDVRMMTEADLDRVVEIASTSSFQRSHFHCDNRFPRDMVNSMHAKWVTTSWEKKQPVAIIDYKGSVAGYFAFRLDDALSDAMGYRYGRMHNLALDPKFRGRGLGERLFNGTIAIMSEMGVEVIDSGYTSKNHISAKLHTKHGFTSVYDEITMHRWLDEIR
ncbi:MAG: GNAT family N-acetyltransferase [Candidatus Thermoplasmatota archaeon]|nr:GNAT family N-acetyltransferase [Candidatus Thermoplasmatota archaeon]